MSRAFVKDDDGGPEREFERPVSDAPNYVTPHGLELLREALARVEGDNDGREARYYRERIDSAIVVDPAKQPRDAVAFGASVVAHDVSGRPLRVRIVGEDEADPARGAISWESPVARALIDHRVGDTVVVARPAGPIQYTIDAIDYR
jgi:transcription elongation factor GreB